MIQLERLNGEKIVVNADLIKFLESTPDTVLTFTDGRTLVVKNSVSEVVSKIMVYRRKTLGTDNEGPAWT